MALEAFRSVGLVGASVEGLLAAERDGSEWVARNGAGQIGEVELILMCNVDRISPTITREYKSGSLRQ